MNKFKFKRFLLAPILLASMLSMLLSASAQIALQPYTWYSSGTTNSGVSPSYAIVGAHSVNNGAPIVTHITAASDKATAKVSFYKVTALAQCAYQTNSTVTLSVVQTNGFASGDVVVIRHISDDSYEKRILTTMTTSTNLITTVAPWSAVIPGDIIYRCTTAGAGAIGLVTNSVAANTMQLEVSGTCIYAGQKGMPLLLEVDQTTASGALNAVSARFE